MMDGPQDIAVMYDVEVPASAEVVVIPDVPGEDDDDDDDDNGGDSSGHVPMDIVTSPPGNLKLTSNTTQTTPSLAKNNALKINKDVEKKDDDSDIDEESACPICFDAWTNSGDHRLVSLPCGHLFGRSCVERWLLEPKNKWCPQCKRKARKQDIRNIFARSIKVIDTTEREDSKKKIVEEKYKRSKAEEGEAKAILQVQLLRAEMEKLKKQVEDAKAGTTKNVDRQSHPCVAAPSSSGSHSSQWQPNASRMQSSMPSYPRLTKSYSMKKSLQISQKDARVMAYDKGSMLMVVSKPSPNQLFAGYGVLKVSSLESRSSEYIPIHQNTIRDAKFNHSGDNLILTASMDKTLKITNALDNVNVLSYTCPTPVWSCAWNESDTNYVYAGLQNGACYFFDIRKLDGEISSMRPRFGVPCPIVSLSYVSQGDEDSLLKCEGVLVGTLQGGWFVKKEMDDSYTDHQLILPEGSCAGIYFEPRTRHALLSQRPGKKSARTCHTVLQMAGECMPERPLHANVVRQCFAGIRAQSLTRSCIYTVPEDHSRIMLCAGDEASSSVIVWDGMRGEEIQKLSCSGGTIFDVLTFEAYNAHFLATLTEQKLDFYQWK